MIAIIDYGMGNLRSVQKAFEAVGAEAIVTQKESDIQSATKVVLPGVGAIEPAIEKLCELKLIDAIKESVSSEKPFLGICLGYQLLFDSSDEGGSVKGLGLLPGTVKRFTSLKVPHMGWNQINIQGDQPLFKDINQDSSVYFCHSYYVQPEENEIVAAQTDYGINFAASVASKNIYGVQFHPEKSQEIGLKILSNFKGL